MLLLMIHADCEGIGFSCNVAKKSTNVAKLTSLQHTLCN